MTFQIERRSNLPYAEFAQTYLYANKPVIVTDAIRQWRALARWTPEFFKSEFGDMKFKINDGEKGALNYKAKGATEYTMARLIDRVLNSSDADPAPYFRNRVLCEEFPTLRQDIEPLPEYFFPNWLPESYLMKSVQQVFNRGAQIELYIGGKGRAFPVLHYDGLASHAFLMHIYGQKKFVLYAPDQERYLYPTPGQPQISRVNNIEQPDLEAFPLFANAAPTTFVLEPGEMLFIPSKWWHTTKMLTACISISTNVVNKSNWAALTDYVESKRKPLMRIPSRIYLNFAGSWRSRRDQRLGLAHHSPA